ncbi:hypothetical protein SDC9_181505 [bioreactor metagenome]|uniref:Uncharacterized protein n=1 Tax=bioreactor metagenome TaxID=1076179 RepID=A0A645HE07_9ZZZZ
MPKLLLESLVKMVQPCLPRFSAITSRIGFLNSVSTADSIVSCPEIINSSSTPGSKKEQFSMILLIKELMERPFRSSTRIFGSKEIFVPRLTY